jgi:hypothetical protein
MAANIIMMENLQEWWNVWSTRILVTLSIVLVWEWWKRTQQPPTPPPPVSTTPTPTPLSYMELNPDRATQTQQRSRLLDRLEQEKQQQQLERKKLEAENNSNEKDEKKDGDKEEAAITTEKATVKRTTAAAAAPKIIAKKKSNAAPARSSSSTNTTTTNNPPIIKALSNAHPGMKGFCYWYEVETSLFRIYTLGRKDGVEVVPPYVPHSYRGNVAVALDVTNHTQTTLNVFWVDYKGKHVLKKSKLKPNRTWTQTTWIDHPWVFEDAETQIPYLYFIPYRVVPTLPDVPTVSADDDDSDGDDIGRFQFSIRPPLNTNDPHYISIDETVMPMGDHHFHNTPLLAITWTLQHMSRMMMTTQECFYMADTLQKYLTNIVNHPEEAKYRQLRLRSPKFAPIWMSPMRGLLLAVGFVEEGAYAELGCAQYPLSRERVQEVALLSYMLNDWKRKQQEQDGAVVSHQQPDGADGSGRAGFGRAGEMSPI